MVGNLTRYGLPWVGVAASSNASAQVAVGRTIETIRLKRGGAMTKAEVSLIRVKANSKAIYELSGAQMDALNAYRGWTVNAAYFDLLFTEHNGMTEADRAAGALDTSDLLSVTLEATIGAGPVAPTLTTILKESAPQPRQSPGVKHLVSKVLRYPFAAAAGGTLPMTLPFGPSAGAPIKRIHINNTGGLMTGITLKEDGAVIHESLLAEVQEEQTAWGRVPQANFYTVDFVLDGNMSKAWDPRSARSIEVLPAFSAADSGFMIVEYLAPWDSL